MTKNKMVDACIRFDDGRWYAVTLGKFIGLLVDAGHDPAVCFRVVRDFGHDDETKTFVRKIKLYLVPDGRVTEMAALCQGIHKVLQKLIEEGVVT